MPSGEETGPRSSGARGLRLQVSAWGLILSLWALLVLAFAGQLIFTTGMPWPQALELSLRDWLPWAFLAPAVAWLAWRFPLERSNLLIAVPVHIVGCMAAVLICELVARQTAPQFRPTPPFPIPERFPDENFRRRASPLPPGVPGRSPLADSDAPGLAPFGSENGDARRPPGAPPLSDLPNANPQRTPRPGPLFPRPAQGQPGPLPGLPNRPAPLIYALVMRAKFNIPIYWVIVAIVHALRYSRRSEERERRARELEARLAEAKLNALRMQLHPHFLFNTLNAISTLVHRDPNAADEMIANLSELLRATLETAEQEIPLRQELEFVDRYLAIQQVRFGGRLRIEKQIDGNCFEARVPTLILQPLVENAIRHGIEPESCEGIVQIQAKSDGMSLFLSVHDETAEKTSNVPGAQASAPSSARRQTREGIGLQNTKARLAELYGNAAHLTLTNSTQRGFTVELLIPYREHGAVTT